MCGLTDPQGPRRDQENDEGTRPLSWLVIALATSIAFSGGGLLRRAVWLALELAGAAAADGPGR